MDTSAHSKLRRIFWRCAVVDPEVMLDKKTPEIDRIKYAVVGALVCMTALAATIGWTYEVSLIALDSPVRIPVSVVLGVGMGLLVFLAEQVVISSIPPTITAVGRFAAFSWRFVLGAFSAALLTIPPVLTYFHNEIHGHLDDTRLAQMADKRKKVDEIFGLSALNVSVENTEKAIVANRKARDELPPHVVELHSRSAACEQDYQNLRRSITPRLEAATTERRQLVRELESDAEQSAERLNARLKELNVMIGGFSRTLTTKAQHCASLARQANAARREYFADLESERLGLQKRKAEQQASLDSAQHEAKPVLERSDEAVRRRTIPDLSAQVKALYELSSENHFIRAVVFAFYAFFLMIECLPVVAKLTARSIYERLLGARERKTAAAIDAEVAVEEAKAQSEQGEAAARLAGARHFHSTDAVGLFNQSAEVRAKLEQDRDEILAGFQQVVAVADAFEQAHRSIDAVAARYGMDASLAGEIQAMRNMLHAAMDQAMAILGTSFRAARP